VDVAKTPAANNEKEKTTSPALTSGAAGLSAGQKLFFVGGIVAVCALFLRSRGGTTSVSADRLKDKSMA
jgi:peptidyl-prolyl cis-trans isomerase B (cyclophilin B)